ncbi:unnamed protein product [Thelazia callipaeda]|uniref:dolichyl-P-Man:Man5GlcNAc2-PP-dolichol alpha-1,3-mannosyltransferase n=1 Tax=Thelazia callipaeda TaxID=103827 RepID=A0A0N5CL71_THECL|nr:unnamed protein product [Thelazia callipaeda]
MYDPFSYFRKSFELNRVFLYKWTVNWRFLSEEMFISHYFHIALFAAHIILLLIAGFTWFRYLFVFREFLQLLRKLNEKFSEMLTALFIANFIGVCVARSLHYQFYSWYFYTLPYLVFSGLHFHHDLNIYGTVSRKKNCGILIGIEMCWNTYPSTVFSSVMLHFFHAAVLCFLISDHYVYRSLKRKKL